MACRAAPTPWPLAAPALVAGSVGVVAVATGSGVLGAHMPSSNRAVCGLPIANTVAAPPVALTAVEMESPTIEPCEVAAMSASDIGPASCVDALHVAPPSAEEV